MDRWTPDQPNEPDVRIPLTLDDPLPVLMWGFEDKNQPTDEGQPDAERAPETKPKRRRRWPLVLAAIVGITGLMAASAAVAYLVAKNTSTQNTSTQADAAQADAEPVATTIQPAVVPIIESAGIDGEPYAQAAALVSPAVVRIQTGFGVGSGVVYDPSGLIMTAAHVVDDVDTVEVLLSDGSRVPGEVVGTHTLSDIGVVRIDPPAGMVVASLADGSEITVGQAVVALGSPFGLEQTVTAGIVSAVDRVVSDIPMVQTDAAINPGNSGGPLVNLSGEVIGISSQIFTESGDNAGVGFAVTVDLARIVADQLVAGQQVQLALLGVSSGRTTDGTAGALISQVVEGSAAEDAGLQVGDRITAVDGMMIRSSSDLRADVLVRRPGSGATLTVQRGGETIEVAVVFGSTG